MNRFGELWKSMTKEEKQPYIDRAKQLQADFKAQNPNYKYKPRKPKPVRQSANHLTLPAGISNAEASYLMLLGAQTLLNQKGGQQQGNQPQVAQLGQAVSAAAAIADVDKNKVEMSALPFATGDITSQQQAFPQLQTHLAAMSHIGGGGPFQTWNQPANK